MIILLCFILLLVFWAWFVEPRLIGVSRIKLPLQTLPMDLEGLRILQFSDLHIQESTSTRRLTQIQKKILEEKPDLILFTGDFLCYSALSPLVEENLRQFLCTLQAPYGCYAILGNHDYNSPVSVGTNGDYDVICPGSPLLAGFRRLFRTTQLTKKTTHAARVVEPLAPLIQLLEKTPFHLLDNTSALIPIGSSALNIVGLGEHIAEKCRPQKAFARYDSRYPGLILSHNPDSVHYLLHCPGNLILSGHTHGGQINLPFIWQKFTLQEDMTLKKGLLKRQDKWIYINRGLGSVINLRFLAIPEISLFTLTLDKENADAKKT